MRLFLIILAAGNSKRLRSGTPKPFLKVNNITLLEHALNAFKNFEEIKRTVIVYNKKHKKFINKLNLKNIIKVEGGSTRRKSTFNALKRIKKMNCKKVLIHDVARPNPSTLAASWCVLLACNSSFSRVTETSLFSVARSLKQALVALNWPVC